MKELPTNFLAGSSLITLDATTKHSTSCSPPPDMINQRSGHMFGMSNGSLVVCGGTGSSGYINNCETFDQHLESWIHMSETLEEAKSLFPSVQIDNNRIWMGRKYVSTVNTIVQKWFP